MIKKYVRNYSSVILALLFKLECNAKFKDGTIIKIRKDDYFDFYEYIYRLYMIDHGFRYNNSICITPYGFKLKLLNGIYSFIIDEIYLMKVYGDKSLNDRIVIDIGASIGDTAIYFVMNNAKKVYTFEPDKERFKLLIENIRLNNLEEKIFAYNIAIDSRKLERFIKDNNLSNIFLKIDCEGCEYDLLLNSTNDVFDRIDDIVLEYHNSPKPLIDRLKRLGYVCNKRGEIIFANKI